MVWGQCSRRRSRRSGSARSGCGGTLSGGSAVGRGRGVNMVRGRRERGVKVRVKKGMGIHEMISTIKMIIWMDRKLMM